MHHSNQCRTCLSSNYYDEDDISSFNSVFECWNCGVVDYLFPDESIEKIEDCIFINTYSEIPYNDIY